MSNALESVGLSPVASNNPLAPVDSPAVLAVLAWVRRQHQQTQSSFGRMFPVAVSSEEPALAPDDVTVVGCDSHPLRCSPQACRGNWTIKFDDEFNGTSLNPKYWKTSWYNGVNGVSLSAANVAVANGNLALTLSSSTVGAAAVTGPVTSTSGFELGAPSVWEARINFPADASGNYLNWPAFWLLDDSGDGATVEIDVAEVWYGTMQTNYHVSG